MCARLVEFGVCAAVDFKVFHFAEVHFLQRFDDKEEKGFEVLWRRRSDEDIAEALLHSARNGNA